MPSDVFWRSSQVQPDFLSVSPNFPIDVTEATPYIAYRIDTHLDFESVFHSIKKMTNRGWDNALTSTETSVVPILVCLDILFCFLPIFLIAKTLSSDVQQGEAAKM